MLHFFSILVADVYDVNGNLPSDDVHHTDESAVHSGEQLAIVGLQTLCAHLAVNSTPIAAALQRHSVHQLAENIFSTLSMQQQQQQRQMYSLTVTAMQAKQTHLKALPGTFAL